MNLQNSLSNRLEKFQPLNPQKVTIYVCGITPYDTTHLGHAFTYISFDVLIRYLKFKGYKVTYTQNVTDINDRDKDILERARMSHTTWRKLSSFWTKKFLKDMQSLNWTLPDHYLKASQNLPFMIKLIQRLLKNGLAYKVGNCVYLDISKSKDFGKLSRFSKSKMLKVAKDFEEDLKNPDKKNLLDITLWRGHSASHSSSGNVKHIPAFSSPFGRGRPGWHIECSAMSMEYMGDQIDIHGGGIDLIFPHHEAEITQSEGATGKKPFVKYWMHTGQVYFQGAKMSKSKGNLVMVSKLLKKYSPNALRWLLLSHQWNKKWEFKEKDLIVAQKNVDHVEKSLALQGPPASQGVALQDEFIKIMDNNLNTPKALKLLLKTKSKEIFDILGFIYQK